MAASFAGDWINAVDCGASGSEFQSVGVIRAGSNEISVEDVGDFRVGQEVAVSRCHRHYYGTVYNEMEPYYARNQKIMENELEFRGLDDKTAWQTFIIHFDKTEPVTFSWMAVDPRFQTKTSHAPVLRREWDWQGKSLPINRDWFALTDGVEARFKKLDWQSGKSVAFQQGCGYVIPRYGLRVRPVSIQLWTSVRSIQPLSGLPEGARWLSGILECLGTPDSWNCQPIAVLAPPPISLFGQQPTSRWRSRVVPRRTSWERSICFLRISRSVAWRRRRFTRMVRKDTDYHRISRRRMRECRNLRNSIPSHVSSIAAM